MTENFNKIQHKKAPPGTLYPQRKNWAKLKGKQMEGVKFRRPYSIDSYVVDFYAPACKLAIEVDGGTHFDKAAIEYDKKRESYI